VSKGRWQISTRGGSRPAWARGGRELYYLDPDDRLMAVTIRIDGARIIAGQPAVLFEATEVMTASNNATNSRPYDVAPDGRFLMIKNHAGSGNPVGPTFVVVHNWVEELKRRVPAR
jgi:eukaryotic-like serine/threonine-protein kinase